MNKAHKIKIYPTISQEILLRKSCGVARFSYNWALARWREKCKGGEKVKRNTLRNELTAIKREQFPWMMEVSKSCPQYAILNLEKAFNNFFNKTTKFPKFKKKGVKDSFVAIENKEAFVQKDFKIRLPRIGWVKCSENLRFNGKVNNVVVKRIADLWFACINIETTPAEVPAISDNQVIVGVDAGVKSLLITSDGKHYENPKALRKRMKCLKRRQRSLSRKQKGGNNRKKQQMKIARLHYKISCVRKDAIHKATTEIVRNADVIVIEDLHVMGMVKNRNLAQALNDASMSEAHRQIKYKAEWHNKIVIEANRFFASSKTCYKCGCKNDQLKLSDRTFECLCCGNVIDRDENAANNLKNYGTLKLSESIRKEKAYGEGSSCFGKSPSAK